MRKPTYGETLNFISDALSEAQNRDIELEDYIASYPTEAEQGVHQEISLDPSDGRVPFLILDNPDVSVENLADANNFLKGIGAAAHYASEEFGFTVYPIIELDDLRDSE